MNQTVRLHDGVSISGPIDGSSAQFIHREVQLQAQFVTSDEKRCIVGELRFTLRAPQPEFLHRHRARGAVRTSRSPAVAQCQPAIGEVEVGEVDGPEDLRSIHIQSDGVVPVRRRIKTQFEVDPLLLPIASVYCGDGQGVRVQHDSTSTLVFESDVGIVCELQSQATQVMVSLAEEDSTTRDGGCVWRICGFDPEVHGREPTCYI